MISSEAAKQSLIASFANAECDDTPYRHWFARNVVPAEMLDKLRELPFAAPDLGGVSGTREVHNKTRNYFDVEARQAYPVCAALAESLQDGETVGLIEKFTGTSLEGTYLRIEYGQDTDGFWLEPHTDIGVKAFTMLLYLSDDAGHEKLGTDIYADKDTHVAQSPFTPNLAMIFVPSDNTWHGVEPRKINGVRKSLIINYVTQDWRAREQLAYPDQTVSAG